MRTKHLLITLIFGLTPLLAFNQSRTVTGTVTSSEDGQALIGVNILVIGTSNGTVTDFEGKYSLDVPEGNDELRYSYTGYNPEVFILEGQTVIDVVLSPGGLLDEVVVVGYGTQRKENLTGAVATIDGEEISKRPLLQTSSALQGQTPGVTVRTLGGGPGDDGGEVRIRGLGTLNNNDPLIVIDGVVGSFTDVDPANIESISVLKDAASAAIYGSRASGGVIMITTKRAQAGQFSVSYNGYVGVQTPTDLPELLEPVEFMELYNKASVNTTGATTYDDDFINSYHSNNQSDPDHYPISDWQNLVMNESPLQQQHSLTFNAGSDKIKALATLLFMDQDGFLDLSHFRRYGIRVNTDITPTEKLRFFADVNLKLSEDESPNSSEGGVFLSMSRIFPILPARYSDDSWGIGWNGDNPWAETTPGVGGVNNARNNLAIINLGFDFEPLEGLMINGAFAPRFSTTFEKNFRRQIPFYDFDTKELLTSDPSTSAFTERYTRSTDLYTRLQLSYENRIGGLSYKAMAGFDQTYFHFEQFFASREGYDFPDFQELNSGSEEFRDNGGYSNELALRSFFGRVNLNFLERYLFEVNFRYDGTSRFEEENRWGTFPSLSVGWRVSEEPFLADSDWLYNFKIRASWGQLGNQNTDSRYPTTSSIDLAQTVVFNNNAFQNAASISALANPNLRWETTTQTDIGFDLGLFDGKLNMVFDYYVRNTEDILISLPIPETSGFPSIVENAAKVQNKGWEFAINYNNQHGKFRYNLGFNLSDVNNKVIDLLETGPFIDGLQITEEGEEMNSIFGLEADGYFQNQAEIDAHAPQFNTLIPGDVRYVDQNNDGAINADDRVIIGSRIPRMTYGGTIELGYAGFDLSLFFQGIGKYNGYQSGHAAWPFQNSGSANGQTRHLDTWSESNPDARYPNWYLNTTTNNYRTSSFWLTDASYFRLNNVVFGYTFSTKTLQNSPFKRVRLYVSGQNVLTIDDMPGFDPEAPLGDTNFYPQTSVYVFGANLTF